MIEHNGKNVNTDNQKAVTSSQTNPTFTYPKYADPRNANTVKIQM